MSATLAAALRLAAFGASTAVHYLYWLAGDLLAAASEERRRRHRHRAFRSWARSTARIARLRVRVRGSAPEAPFLLATNHLGYLDVVVLSSVVDCTYVARGDVESWPGIGRLCRAMRVIFVDRARRGDVVRVAGELRDALERGESVVLFPEGTSTRGDDVAPFKPSLLEAAAATRRPVHVAALGYRTPPSASPAHVSVCWWGEMTFPAHFFNLFRLPAIEAEVVFGNESIVEVDRKVLAARLRDAVVERFTPVVTKEEA